MTTTVEGPVFVDTNVLIYALAGRAGEKRKQAGELLEGLWGDGRGVLSVQVLSEAAVTLRRKAGLTWKRIGGILAPYLLWEVVALEPGDVLLTLEIAARHRISLWDAWIVRAAAKGGAAVLATEDLSDGQVIEGVQVKNPFV